MRKVIILLLIVCTSFNAPYYSTTWAGTALNQGLTLSALNNAVSTLVLYQNSATTIPTTLQLCKVSSLTTYNIGNTLAGGKSSSQIITKGDFFTITIQGGADFCGNGGSGTVYTVYLDNWYYNGAGVHVYTNNGYSTPFVGAGAGYYYKINGGGGASLEISSAGVIIAYNAC